MRYIERPLNKVSTFDYYSLFLTFLVSGFFGWLFEITTMYFLQGLISSRGLWFVYKEISYYFPFIESVPIVNKINLFWGLPIIVVYGFGGCLVSVFVKNHHNNLYVFFVGMILLTLFELISSYFCEYILDMSLWDYSKEKINFQGRICLRASIAWGLISILCVRMLVPTGFQIYVRQRRINHYKVLTNMAIVYTIICIVYRYLFWGK